MLQRTPPPRPPAAALTGQDVWEREGRTAAEQAAEADAPGPL